ncbi:MAG TPA: cupredoxin domain-containing protein [Candidatus Acidoferrales bacterium]|nr:cupredoxin domain-containing protein [Candidatus Acidoferrales bacterium]
MLVVSLCAVGLSANVVAQQTNEFRVVATEFSFKPSRVKVPLGEVKISVTNRGQFPHGVAIEGRNEKIGYIESGETESLTLRLDQPGEIVFYCPQPGHRRKGMEGRLTVGK